MSGHTLGPWNLGSRAGPNRHVTGERDAGNGKAFTSAPGNIIAYVPISRPEEEANAALIAAAPEMVEALEAAFTELDSCSSGHWCDRRDRSVDRAGEIRDRIRAALRKAGVLP